MFGLIQDRPLLVSDTLAHAALYHADTPIISRRRDGSFHRSNWNEVEGRVRKLAGALIAAGVGRGDRVATLAWNNHCRALPSSSTLSNTSLIASWTRRSGSFS
jgi:fatty-acyl-CoA synthase